MKRNLTLLTDKTFDLIIIGGGIFGICAAWDATLRGLSVALVEKRDFAGATSANSFKMIHGGIRYLQHADIIRMRQSIRERRALLRVAPHLASPLPIVIPTYGHGTDGKEILAAGLFLYDAIALDRNWGVKDPSRQIPRGHLISRQEVLGLFPGLKKIGLTGAAVFNDGQMYNPPRLALSFLKSAVFRGAVAANYVEVDGFLRTGNRICGVKVQDTITGSNFEIRGKVVLNAAGPWAEQLLAGQMDLKLNPGCAFSRDACFVIARQLHERFALAVQARTKDPDAILSRKGRHLFIVPWRNYSLIGVWHVVHRAGPNDFRLSEEDLAGFIQEINQAYPPLDITHDDVTTRNAGLVLFGENKAGATDLSYGKRSRIVDHAKMHNLEGIITLIGVRYTTARDEAAKAVDLIFRKIGKPAPRSTTETTPIYGGSIDRFEQFLNQALLKYTPLLNAATVKALLHNHGSAYPEVLKCLGERSMYARTIGQSNVIEAEIIHAVRDEMAMKLGDVVFRRTGLGTGAFPALADLKRCADLMAAELHWGSKRTQQEIDEIQRGSIKPKYVTPREELVDASLGNK